MFSAHTVKKVLLIVPLIIFASLMNPAQAHAWRDRHSSHDRHESYGRDYFRHHNYPYGRTVRVLPRSYISISIGGGRFYYSSGVFYKHRSRDYVVVDPPRGAVVRFVPHDCDRVIIRGATYYRSNGIYYRVISGGYQVVDPPSTMIVEQPAAVDTVTVTGPAQGNAPDTYTVNIPNNRGGYTAVVLKGSGSGYIGPQGEFYPDFPKVEQLKLMYAK